MEPIPKSGLYYPNRFGRITLKAIEEVMGENGLKAILNLAHLTESVDLNLPDDLDKAFDFNILASIGLALEELYGVKGCRGFAQRVGRSIFADALRNFGAMTGTNDQRFRMLPRHVRLKIGIPAVAKIFSEVSDQENSVSEFQDEFIFTIHRCPMCWGRSEAEDPVCYFMVGLLQECMQWLSNGGEYQIWEKQCIARGDSVCAFHLPKESFR